MDFGAFDVFSIPVSLFATRRKQHMGSIPGFMLTVLLFILLLVFIVYKTADMLNLSYDNYTSQVLSNDFSSEYNDFTMDSFDFMPSIKISIKNKSKFTGNTILDKIGTNIYTTILDMKR